jgi:hypothetical protein
MCEDDDGQFPSRREPIPSGAPAMAALTGHLGADAISDTKAERKNNKRVVGNYMR